LDSYGSVRVAVWTRSAASAWSLAVRSIDSICSTSSGDSPNLVLDSIDDSLLGNLAEGEAPPACGNLAPGATCTFDVSRTVLAGDPDPLENTVMVHYHPAEFPNDITDSDSHSVDLFQPSVTIDKTGDELSKVGDSVDYVITVTNTSSPDSPNLTCDIADELLGIAKQVSLAPGEQNVTNASREVKDSDTDPLVNTASVTCTVDGFGNVIGPETDSHSVALFAPSVEVVKDGPSTANVGDTITYSFVINNTSSGDSPNLVLDSATDTVLGNLTTAASDAGCGTRSRRVVQLHCDLHGSGRRSGSAGERRDRSLPPGAVPQRRQRRR
jgi:uncharacterized repeat protein (TIGR01451 family)